MDKPFLVPCPEVQTLSDDVSYGVGIGASAGGLEALRAFFSAMVERLARLTAMPVVRAEEGMAALTNHVYLIPPRFNPTISEGIVHLVPPPGGKTLNLMIDIFFRSLAHSERASLLKQNDGRRRKITIVPDISDVHLVGNSTNGVK